MQFSGSEYARKPETSSMTKSIIKRDGTHEEFVPNKIWRAVHTAFKNVGKELSDPLFVSILRSVETHSYWNAENENSFVHIDLLQDTVEHALMENAPPEVSKHYILYRAQRDEKRAEACTFYDVQKIPDNVVTPWGPLGYVTFKRTYARVLKNKDNVQTESFRETILRVLDASQKQLGVGFSVAELKRAYKYMMSLQCSVAGRFLWQLGTETVDRFGLMSLQNCAFVQIDEPIEPFLFIFDILMLGVGCGASVERKFVKNLPTVLFSKRGFSENINITRKDTSDADFIVPDSREGWVSLLEKVLQSFFVTGKDFSYSTMLIRSKGAPIKGFGGVASGAEDLCKGIANIVGILQKKQGKNLSSVDCLDIVDIIGSIVVAGNIRRSAILIIGDHDDEEYLTAKLWERGNIPNWRCMSNNSVNCNDPSVLDETFWQNYYGTGEPIGIVNPTLAATTGRIIDGNKYPDFGVCGFNPCAEQSLCNYETCCLGEIFLPNIQTKEELFDNAVILYRICKHSLNLPCHHERTQQIVRRNQRMGIGITGYLQCTEEQKSWLPSLYEYLRHFDAEYSRKNGFNESVKLTTVKPSGTLSLLPNVTPGCHPGIYKHYIRRIRISSDNPLLQICKNNGFHTEFQKNFDGSEDTGTTVVSFPCSYKDGTTLAHEMTAIDQLNVVRHLQYIWSDNAVSCTVYYKQEELNDIKKWLAENFQENIKVRTVIFFTWFSWYSVFENVLHKYRGFLFCYIPITILFKVYFYLNFYFEIMMVLILCFALLQHLMKKFPKTCLKK